VIELMRETSAPPRVVLVSPTRNEEKSLLETVAAVEAQTLRPALWILVDDGSSDRTPELLREVAKRLPWVRVVTRPDRGFRKVGGGVIEAFDAGAPRSTSTTTSSPSSTSTSRSAALPRADHGAFAADPRLAAASGRKFRREGGALVEEFIIDEMVAGQFKLYRREAFERIGGFVREVMWDGIDIHRCRMNGFTTASFADPELAIIHLRVMGSTEKSVYHGRLRWGRGQWFMGSSFPYVVASGLFRMKERPYVVGGLLIVAGYVGAWLRGAPRYSEPEFRRELRRWQHARLKRLFTRGGVR
jgi:hypothetical protein